MLTRVYGVAFNSKDELDEYLKMLEEAKKYLKILGYNYNSSQWYKQSYKIVNKDYKIENSLNSKEEKELREYIQNCLENNRHIFKEHILNILKINGRTRLD